jgi:hypothetical protein
MLWLYAFCVVLCIVCFVSFCVLFVCKCVVYYCHQVATQLHLTNISKLRLFSHKVFFIINTCFSTLREALCVGTGKLFAEAPALFRHAVFQLVIAVVCKTASSGGILRGGQKGVSWGMLSRGCRGDEGEEILGAESCG